MNDFNGVDVHQFKDRIVISAEKYIDRIMQTHGWATPSAFSERDPNRPQSPIPANAINEMYTTEGFDEGTKEHQKLTEQHKFSFRTLLGELMFAYVSCRPDIGYAVITLSKFVSKPGDFHFRMLKNVARYLRNTKTWGIHYYRTTTDKSLPACPFDTLSVDPDLPMFPSLEQGPSLTCFIDAAHANDLRNRRSTTGYAFQLSGGCISYKCKTQPITATSSTEAEFYAAVTAAKHARYLRAILHELGFPQCRPTPIYCDNEPAIDMINSQIPTERARHVDISYFAIQEWKQNDDIILYHIPGIINPSDGMTKPLGWILHSRHSRRLMGHYGPKLDRSCF